MMKNKQIIGDFLKRIKRPINLSLEKEYKLVTIKMNHNGIVLRGLKKGGDIKSNMYEVKQGDFILSGIDARNGAFGIVPAELDGAIVTNDFWYFEIDESIINKALFLELTSTTWFDEICKRGSDGTTQRIRLQKDKFFNQEIYLPLPDSQQELLIRIQSIKTKQVLLHQQSIEQQEQVKQLKQAILQEAIQGKLTKDWRIKNSDVEPASELLKRIKVEKQKLIDEKKTRKEKPLQPIIDEEIPFALPDGWVWCRLGEIIELKSGQDLTKQEYNVKNKGLPYLTGASHIVDGDIKVSRWTDTPKSISIMDDLLITCKGTIGKTTFNIIGDIHIARQIMAIRLIEAKLQSGSFLKIYIDSYVLELISKAKSLIPGVSRDDILLIYFPLPSFLEQKAIEQKVESLMQNCTALESEIKQSETHAKALMQAVIKEAFESDKIKEIS